MLDGKQKLLTLDDDLEFSKFQGICFNMCQNRLPKGIKWDDGRVDIKLGWLFCTTKQKSKADTFVDIDDREDYKAMIGEIQATKKNDEYTLKIRAKITVQESMDDSNTSQGGEIEIQSVFSSI
jgi:hypothetical protein